MGRNSFKYVTGVTLQGTTPKPILRTIIVGNGKGECAAGEGNCKEHLTLEQWIARRDQIALNIAGFEEETNSNPMDVFEQKDEESIYTASTDYVGRSIMTLKEIHSKLSGLHFAKEALSDGEREILYMAEALLNRVNDINDTVKPRKPRQPKRSAEMKELLAQKENLQETIDLQHSIIYTLQQDPYNQVIKKRRISGIRRRITNLKNKIAALDEQISQLKY